MKNSKLVVTVRLCEDATSKLVEIVPVADFDSEQLVDDSSVHIWKLKFGHKIEFLPRL